MHVSSTLFFLHNYYIFSSNTGFLCDSFIKSLFLLLPFTHESCTFTIVWKYILRSYFLEIGIFTLFYCILARKHVKDTSFAAFSKASVKIMFILLLAFLIKQDKNAFKCSISEPNVFFNIIERGSFRV